MHNVKVFIYFDAQITQIMTYVPSSQLEDVEIDNTPTPLNADLICGKVDILNNTGKEINVTQYANGVAGKTYKMPINTTYWIEGIENANQVEVSNATDGRTITLPFRFYS